MKFLLALQDLLLEVARQTPFRFTLLVMLIVLSTSLTGVGVLLIVPLLALAGIRFEDPLQQGQSLQERLQQFFSYTGLTLDLNTLLILYAVIVTLVGIIQYQRSVQSSALQAAFAQRLRKETYTLIVNASWAYLRSRHSADFVRVITGQLRAVSALVTSSINLLVQIIVALVYVGFCLVLSPLLTCIAGAGVGCLFLISVPLRKQVAESGETELLANRELYHSLSDQLRNLMFMKSLPEESVLFRQLLEVATRLEIQQVVLSRVNAMTALLNQVATGGLFILLVVVGLNHASLPVSELVVLFVLFSRLMPRVTGIQTSLQQLAHRAPVYWDVQEVREALRQNAEVITSVDEFHRPWQELRVANVSYRYAPHLPPVLESFSAIFPARSLVVIDGESGVGKSTLVDILSGLVAPDTGEVFVDEVCLTNENRPAWRRRVAYVTQNQYLLDTSIRENLIWASGDCSDEQLLEALRKVELLPFIESLPETLDYVIGEGGERLSGGQRQRLVLARALLMQPDLLILDEALNALDEANRRAIGDLLTLLRRDCTIVAIDHSDYLNAIADAVISLE